MKGKNSQLFSNSVALGALLTILFFLRCVDGNKQILVTSFPTGTSVQLRMQGGNPTENGQLVCTGFTLTSGDEFWITQIKGIVAQSNANIGMNLYGCNYIPTNPCSCPLSQRSLISSWGKFTPAIQFASTSSTMGFHVGGNSQIKILFIEVWYPTTISTADFSSGFDLEITRTSPTYQAAILSFMAFGTIPGQTAQTTLDACITIPSTQPKYPIKTLAYRPHTESYGKLVSLYVKSSATEAITELGRGNPQFPQAYYVTAQSYSLYAGDTIMLRCVYDTTSSSTPIITNGFKQPYQEMCIMNILWISDSASPLVTTSSFLTGTCTSSDSLLIPSSSTTLLQGNPTLEAHALDGSQTGIVTIDATHSVNLDKETFASLYP